MSNHYINFGRWSSMVVGPFNTRGEAQDYIDSKSVESAAYRKATIVEAKPPLGPIVTLTVRLAPSVGPQRERQVLGGRPFDVGSWWAERLAAVVKASGDESVFADEFLGVEWEVEFPSGS